MQQLTIFDYLPSQERPVDICERLFKTGRQPRRVSGRVRALAPDVIERMQAEPIAVETVLTLEREDGLVKYAPPKSDSVQPCHYCGQEMGLKSWDILTFKLQPILKFECKNDHWLNFYPPPIENEEERNHVSDKHCCVTVWHTGSGKTLKTLWTTSAPWMRDAWEKIRAEEKSHTNTQALEAEAAELREKIAGVQFIRNQQKLAAELKEQRENASKEIQLIMGRGHSRMNDEAAAHWGSIFDSLSAKISLIEEDIPSIIPATWRWEVRLAEIEKELGKGENLCP